MVNSLLSCAPSFGAPLSPNLVFNVTNSNRIPIWDGQKKCLYVYVSCPGFRVLRFQRDLIECLRVCVCLFVCLFVCLHVCIKSYIALS